MEYWIEFDIDNIRDLRIDYENTMETLLEMLPECNWNSRTEVKAFFHDEFNIHIYSLKIADLQDILTDLNVETSVHAEYTNDVEEAKEVLTLLIELYKLKYTCKNYLDCILRHETEGRVYLREFNGRWVMPNRQPYNIYHPEIKSFITSSNLP